jgi:hypothetical protein
VNHACAFDGHVLTFSRAVRPPHGTWHRVATIGSTTLGLAGADAMRTNGERCGQIQPWPDRCNLHNVLHLSGKNEKQFIFKIHFRQGRMPSSGT